MRLLSALLFYADLQRNDAVEVHLFRQVVFFQQLGTAAVGAEAGVCKVETEHGFRNLFQLKVVALLRQLLLSLCYPSLFTFSPTCLLLLLLHHLQLLAQSIDTSRQDTHARDG